MSGSALWVASDRCAPKRGSTCSEVPLSTDKPVGAPSSHMTFEEQLTSAFDDADRTSERRDRSAGATRVRRTGGRRALRPGSGGRCGCSPRSFSSRSTAARRDAHDHGLVAGREAADVQAREELARAVAVARQEAHEQGFAAGREAADVQAREELARAVAVAREDAHAHGLAAGREAADAQAREELARAVAAARRGGARTRPRRRQTRRARAGG